MTIDYTQILARKYPDAEWIINGDEYAGLVWLSDTPKPTKATLDGLWNEVKAMIEAEQESRIALKASAVAKLSALGLTDDEVKAIIG